MQKQFRGIVLFIFLYIILDLQQKQMQHWKERDILLLIFVRVRSLVLNDMGIHTARYEYMHAAAAHTSKP
jgi:hypothetical protein